MPQAPAGLLQPEPTSRLPVRPVLPEAPPLEAAARSYRDFLRQHDAADPRTLDSWCDSFPGHDEHARLFRDIHRANPQAASQLAEGLTAFPDVGTDFLGFHLVGELGRGAFGRVYLAQQGDLANRPVALKVSGEIDGESQMLARLQHTHIVPIYSYHRAGPLHAVCMPYLGSTTLADVLRDLGARGKLPESGKGLLSTLYDRKSRTTPTADGSKPSAVPGSAKDAAAAVTQSRQPADARPANVGDVTLRMLEGMSYVHAVLWVGACLADGLAHAHQRGILHRDLKPANVLLTDDGQPMLLDFNLSAYSKSEADASIALLGGTLPYMAPEHLAAFDGYELTPDARSDIYSLGIILYELLTGRHPFERRRGAVPAVLPAMVADRLQPPPALRHWNRAISPAVEAIVRHCLEPEPSKRYQTARQLHEDLERQCANLPLRHVREPSLRERAAKWYRRHPRFAPFGIATLAGLLLLVTATLLIVRGQELASRRAVAQRDRFRAEMREARLLLNSRIDDPDQRRQGKALALEALGRYQLPDNPAWQESELFKRLADPDQSALRREFGELFYLLAGAESLQSTQSPEPLRRALQLNELAEQCCGSDAAPRALWLQRADLFAALGRKDEEVPLRERARQTPVRDGWAHYLLGRQHFLKGQLGDARTALREATRLDPRNFGAWLLLGNSNLVDGLGRESDAAACYTTCIALWPDCHVAYFNRGLALWRLHRFDEAAADFSRSIELRPDHVDSYLQRALAWEGLRNFKAADADLTKVLTFDSAPTQAYLLRARVREALGDKAGARQDREEGMRRRPTDELSWIQRGMARVEKEPKGALADFAEAVKCNPRSLAGLQNQAHVLAEKLGQTEEAIRKLDQLVRCYPDFAPALGWRGVLRARLGQRTEARRDAEAMLRCDPRPPALYQAAGVYALSAPKFPEDRREALRLLAGALQQGYGFDFLDIDKDLDPLRQDRQFRDLVAGARTARTLQAPVQP